MRGIGGVSVVAAVFCIWASSGWASNCSGTVHRVGDGGEVSVDAFDASIPAGAVLLVGERHGIVIHPQIAACLIDRLAGRGQVSLVLEQVATDRQSVLDHYRAQHPEHVDGLDQVLHWSEAGWPRWSVYAPMFEAAWRTRSVIVAGDRPIGAPKPTNAMLSAMTGDATSRLLGAWEQSMAGTRCGLAPAEELRSLAREELARDQAFARVLAAVPSGRFTIFYGGRSHVRRDVSIPFILSRIAPNRPVISIALYEISQGAVGTDRDKVLAEAEGHYDYVWFAGEAQKGDVCSDLRARGLIP